jgi:hypothetical protein
MTSRPRRHEKWQSARSRRSNDRIINNGHLQPYLHNIGVTSIIKKMVTLGVESGCEEHMCRVYTGTF